jgi:hypothetical protein
MGIEAAKARAAKWKVSTGNDAAALGLAADGRFG